MRPSSPPTSCNDLAPGSQLLTLLRLADCFVENFPRQGFWRDRMELGKVLRDQQLAGREEMELGSNSARTAAQRPAPAVADSLGVAGAPASSASWREQGRGSPAAQRALASMVGPPWSRRDFIRLAPLAAGKGHSQGGQRSSGPHTELGIAMAT